jgi:hypothetical protein
LKQIDIEEKKSTIAKIAKPLDEKKISEIISSKKESEERREGFMLDENLEIEAIDRKALVVYETFIRASTSATSRREGTVSKDSLIWIAGKVKGTNYYLANDLNGIPIGFVLMSNVSLDDLGNEKGKDDFDFGPYYALLIANDDYKNKGFVDLDTPINDAKAIKSVLENKYGFKVKTLYDATEDQIQEAISSYQDILTEKDNFLIYYAGHGDFKESNQVGYWQGVDAVEKKSWTWIANTDVTNEIKAIKANHVIVIADSCYSGTIITQRSGDEGITREQKNRKDFLKKKYSKTTRVALTSGDIEKVSDAEHGSKHSPFAESLINILKENEETLFSSELHTLIEDQMSLKRTDQLPLWGKIIDTGHKDGGDFAFNPIE